MKNTLTLLGFIFFFGLIQQSVSAQSSFNENANTFFEKFVQNGAVDYTGIKQQPEQLNLLVKEIENYTLTDDKSNYPFYLNAYNVLVINQIIQNYPIDSPMSIDGFFDKNTFNVAGKNISLNHLENEIIRPTYKDARIHFALVCGAVGCPKLANKAFTNDNVQSLLTKNTRKALNNPDFIKYDGQNLAISKIFDWYKEDFGGDAASFLKFINEYRENAIPENTEVGYYEYDWSVNKQ